MDASLGALIRGHRLTAGLTQEALAERAGLSSQAVGALERGDRRFPHRETVTRLAEALRLTDDQHAGLVEAARRRGTPRRQAPGPPRPRQLPPDIAHFTGRAEIVEAVCRGLECSDAVAVWAVAGMGGVGKTALSVHIGHRMADRFPDGQLFLDLRGTAALAPREAVGQLLRALGATKEGDAADLDEAAARLRSVLAGRRTLLILDNAASVEQVAPLLPGTAGCAALITSRRTLDALPQARHVRLDVLSDAESLALLAANAGQARVDAEPEAAARIVRYCAGLPLALRLAGARLAARPGWSLEHMVARLGDEQRRLDELQRDDLGVRASFAVSLDNLDPVERRRFALLCVPELTEVTLPLAARLLDLGERETERLLERLTDMHLLDASAPGRYRVHDLLRVYGREWAAEHIPAPDSAAALRRGLDLMVAVAWRSMVPTPGSVRLEWADPAWTESAPPFDGPPQALAWLDDHREQLLGLATTAAADPERIVRLAIGLFGFYLGRGRWLDWSRMAEVGLAAAERGPDRFAEALVRMDLGIALADLAHEWSDDNREALCHLRRSRSDLHALGMPRAVITCLINMCDVLEAAGDFRGGIACAEECLAMCRDLGGLPPAEAATNINLGNLYGKVGDHDKQLACYHAAVRITDEIDYDIGRAYALRGIGEVLLTTGELDDAVSFLQDSIALYRTIGDPSAEAAALELLGRVHLARDEPAAATDALDDALALARNYDDRARQASVLAHLGTARVLCPPVERVPEL